MPEPDRTRPRHDLRPAAPTGTRRRRRRSPRRSSSARSTSSPTSTRSTPSTRAARPGFVYARDGHPNAAAARRQGRRARGGRGRPGLRLGDGGRVGPVPRPASSQGDRVALSEGLYGRTVGPGRPRSWPGSGSATTSSTRPGPRRSATALTPRTRLVFVETLSNPLLRLADIEGLAAIARPAGVDPGGRPHVRPPALPAAGAGGRRR